MATTIVKTENNQSRPIVWSIAASDSGGGAGIQADLNTIHSLDCHGCTVITAITAQNSLAVEKIHPISAVDLAAQWQALEKDLLPQAIKIGLLPEPSTLRWLARHLEELRVKSDFFCVWDPVLKASTGARFLDAFDRGEIDPLLNCIDLITPNLAEAQMLTKIKIESFKDIERAANQLLERGAKNVLIKGGHSFDQSANVCRDYFANPERSFWVCHDKQDQDNNHGTGCTLASAIASFKAQGNNLSDSLVLANQFIQQSLRLAVPQGAGAGPVWQSPLQDNPADFPAIEINSENFSNTENLSIQEFAQCEPLGLYAIVNTLEDLKRLIEQGVDTLQWRDKNLTEKSDDSSLILKQAIDLCAEHQVPLYINDHWQLALEFNAYGIHLGQEDLALLSHGDCQRIQQHGLRLGISCHNPTELAIAHNLKPSYLAFGPIFSPKSKVVDHDELGLQTLKQWQASYGTLYQTTCIGGIELKNLAAVLETGIQSVAVISALGNKQEGQTFIQRFQSLQKTT